jgi:aldose sugar dehydrogenase
LTGKLWDSENGAEKNDEVNLVEPGFNSGWKAIQGMSSFEKGFNPAQLVDFDGNGIYSDPEFVWYNSSVGPTALKFLTSDKLGDQYQNDLFVGDFNNGYIYHFELNEARTELILNNSGNSNISKILENIDQSETFAQGPGGVIDIQVGPDGYLYVLTLLLKGSDCIPDEPGCVTNNSSKVKGAIFRIVPTTSKLVS